MAPTAATGRRAGRHDVPFSKPDEVLFPGGITEARQRLEQLAGDGILR